MAIRRLLCLLPAMAMVGCGSVSTSPLGRDELVIRYENGAVSTPSLQESELRQEAMKACPLGFSRMSEGPIEDVKWNGWSWVIRCN